MHCVKKEKSSVTGTIPSDSYKQFTQKIVKAGKCWFFVEKYN